MKNLKISEVLKIILSRLPQDDEVKTALKSLADVKFIDLPAIVSQNQDDIFAVSANGTGSYKETRVQLSNSMADLLGIASGVWTPTFVINTGITGDITENSAMYIQVGNIVIFSQNISFTANDSYIEFTSSVPINSNFTLPVQASLMGGVFTTSSPNVGDGDVTNLVAVASSSTVKIAINATVGDGLKHAMYAGIYGVFL